MNRLLSLSLLTLHATYSMCTDNQNAPSKETIEQEIAEFDTFFDQNKEEIAQGTGIIQFKITIYKDQSDHNKQDWQALITRTAQACSRIRRSQLENKTITNVQEEIDTIINLLENKDNSNGIITEFSIETSDGAPVKGCCGDHCTCIERYYGNCPCSLDNNINRCLFPGQELPFDDQYEEDESLLGDSSDSDVVDSEDEDGSYEIDTNKKRCCCR